MIAMTQRGNQKPSSRAARGTMVEDRTFVQSGHPRTRAFLAVLFIVAPTVSAQPLFRGIGDLPGGAFSSAALGVSANGLVIIGYGASSKGTQEAFRWTGGVMTSLGELPEGASNSFATGVSQDGSVIVGAASSASGTVAFRWENDIMQPIGVLPGMTSSAARGISRNAAVISGNSYVGEPCCYSRVEGCRWLLGSIGPLIDLDGGVNDSAVDRGISADGTVIVGRGRTADSQHYQACRWDADVEGSYAVTALGYLPGGLHYSQAIGISGDAAVIVGLSSSSRTIQSPDRGEACRWDFGAPTPLGDLPGGQFESVATGVSDDGAIIVGAGTTDAGEEAFVWDAQSGMRRLQDVLECLGVSSVTGWRLVNAYAITPDGQTIVGRGINPAGSQEGWVASIPHYAFCAANFNCDGVVNSQDFFDFLSAFFLGAPPADFNHDSEINSQDFFDFLTAFFAGC